ncbi:MAG TPA: hypothetical protein VFO54_05585, partial [Chryseosolibacter sp.]|nr:hypothetical protein [Chryseosolibacter sp.]
KEGVLFPVAVFLLIIMQVDTFVYMENLGSLIFAWLLSFAVMRKIPEPNRSRTMKNEIEMQNVR